MRCRVMVEIVPDRGRRLLAALALLGGDVNSRHDEVCPVVTADGEYLFFLRASSECNDVYWTDADVIERLRPDEP